MLNFQSYFWSESTNCFLPLYFGGAAGSDFSLLLESCADPGCVYVELNHSPGLSLPGCRRSKISSRAGSGIQRFQLGTGTNFHKRALASCPAARQGGRQQIWFREEGRVKLHLGSARPCTRCCLWLDSRSWSFAHVVPGIYLVGSLLLQQDLWIEGFYHHLPH